MIPEYSIAHYRITAKLGEGGMGQVYRARDSRLGRDVAIKVLPSMLAGDAQYMARFEREAQTLAALNHPNIAAVYGIEEGAIVMELVEGETLPCPVAIDIAMNYARQIAEGLEAAHEKGIVHRDLKPGNIRVTADGRVKILDFGLAKSVGEPAPDASASISPTLSLAMTQAGMILGTAAYMAPEQARGKPVDKRADIWAFGVVFYEMLTGRKLFDGGETVADTLASVVKDAPDLSALPIGTPPHVRHLLERCLRKDPVRRLRDIGEARIALDEAPPPVGSLERTSPKRARLPWMLAAASLLALAVYAGWRESRPAVTSTGLARLGFAFPSNLALDDASNGAIALSRDGSRIALALQDKDGRSRIYTRELRQDMLTVLEGTDNASAPFFSPDGRWIGYADAPAGVIKKVPVEGGGPVVVCQAQAIRGADWGMDGTIVFTRTFNSHLARVSSSGGDPKPITALKPGERTHRWPQLLPGGAQILFTAHNSNANYDDAEIDVVDLRSGQRKTLVRGGFHARYLPTGHLLYLRQGSMFAVPFDLGKLTVTGAAVKLLDTVFATNSAGGFFDVANNGSMVYVSGRGGTSGFVLSLFDERGTVKPITSTANTYLSPAYSPDGDRIAFTLPRSSGSDVWVKDLQRDVTTRLTFMPGFANSNAWSPDGRTILFRAEGRDESAKIYQVPADGSGEPMALSGDWGSRPLVTVSPDRKFLIGHRFDVQGIGSLQLAALQESAGVFHLGKLGEFAAGPGSHTYPKFSPDGRWLAYVSDESGRAEVYVKAFPKEGGRRQVSVGGGSAPVWSRSSRELLFQGSDRRILRVTYAATANSISFGSPVPWGNVRPADLGGPYSWDLSPDGKQVVAALVAGRTEEKPITELNFLVDFFDEVKRKFR